MHVVRGSPWAIVVLANTVLSAKLPSLHKAWHADTCWHPQVVSMRELGEAVQRTRYGINGGAALLPGRGLRRRLGDWLLDTLAPRRIPARTLGSA